MIGLNSLHITPDMLRMVSEIERFNGAWEALDQHVAGLHLVTQATQRGAKLKPLLVPLEKEDLTPQLLFALHKIWDNGPRTGCFKRISLPLDIPHNGATVGTLDTADPGDVEGLLTKLLSWVNETLSSELYHPLQVIAVFTAVFLQIAPFETGNLPLARFLIVLLMLKSGYSYAPFSDLDARFEANGDLIFQALEVQQRSVAQGRPDWDDWMTCFFHLLAQDAVMLREQMSDNAPTEASTDLPALSLALLECLHRHKRATMALLMKETTGRRSTIKLRLHELISNGLVKRHGSGRGVWYGLV